MKAAIHQPNFFPWLGFFNKVKSVDTFIFFDNVQRQQGKSWVTRVKLYSNNKELWLTIPINKSGNSIQKICETSILNLDVFKKDLMNKLTNYYRKSPYTEELIHFLNKNWPETNNISMFNGSFIQSISREIGFKTDFVYCSERNTLLNNDRTGNDIIIDVCEEFNVNDYLSGTGCLDFFKPELLEERGIAVNFQQLNFIPYPQYGNNEFVKGLSILDLLANVGFANASQYI